MKAYLKDVAIYTGVGIIALLLMSGLSFLVMSSKIQVMAILAIALLGASLFGALLLPLAATMPLERHQYSNLNLLAVVMVISAIAIIISLGNFTVLNFTWGLIHKIIYVAAWIFYSLLTWHRHNQRLMPAS